jgi:hypothetical protein
MARRVVDHVWKTLSHKKHLSSSNPKTMPYAKLGRRWNERKPQARRKTF